MKTIIGYLKAYLADSFSWKLYTSLAIYIALVIAFDYTFHFQQGVLYRLSGWEQWPAFSLFYGAGYLGAVAIIALHRKNVALFKHPGFWLFFACCFLMLGLYKSFSSISEVCNFVSSEACGFIRKVVRYLSGLLTIMLPAFLLWKWKDRENPAGFFGINRQQFDWKPYGWMLLIMLPILGAASFLPSFIKYYPIYKKTFSDVLAASLELPEWPFTVVYELAYATGFINVELFFRGVLVWAMFRFLGKDSVLAMVAVYAMFHFVKPLGETISSVFGGFVLGAISLQTRSIWGGICIHVSIAWLMEFFAGLQHW